jgi:predicted dehydrogenase
MNLTRRNFAQLAAVGAATQLIPAQEIRPIGFCIVGLGRISMQHFMPGCRLSKYAKVTAIASGHRDKADKWAADYGVPARSIYSYENYDAIADNKDIDAVYIALPNSMHAEYTIRAARAGKHVLCEKPMSTSVADAEAMIAACKKANRKLQIAYRCQFEPCNLHAIRLIREGALGAVQSIVSANGFNIRPGEWRYDGKLGGGGPLMDVGIYSLNACRYLTGEEPVELKGYASVLDRDGRFKDVEETLSWTMRFPSGVTAACTTTYGASMPGYYTVYGSKGTLHLEPAFGYQGQHLTGRVESGPIDDLAGEKDPAHFPRQADHLAECIALNKEPKTSGLEGLRDMQWIEKIYQSCGRKLPAIA